MLGGLLENMLTATLPNFDQALNQLKPHLGALKSDLEREVFSDSRERSLRAKLALVEQMPDLVPELTELMLDADALQADAIISVLKPFAAQLQRGLWDVVSIRPTTKIGRILNAFSFLAKCCPDDSKWANRDTQLHLVMALVSEDLNGLPIRVRQLKNVQNHLLSALQLGIRDTTLGYVGDERTKIYTVWDVLVKDDTVQSIDLMLGGPPWMFNSIVERLKDDQATTDYLHKLIEREVDKHRSSWIAELQKRHLAGIALVGTGPRGRLLGFVVLLRRSHSLECPVEHPRLWTTIRLARTEALA